MLRKCAAVLAVVSCLAAVTSARAEPGPVGRWLMNEPASLFDLGMIRLNMEAKTWERPHDTFNIEMKEAYGGIPLYFAKYDWDENRIAVEGWLLSNFNETPDALIRSHSHHFQFLGIEGPKLCAAAITHSKYRASLG